MLISQYGTGITQHEMHVAWCLL